MTYFTTANLVFPQKESNNAKYNGLLEKKWTSVIRLQKKVGVYSGCRLIYLSSHLYVVSIGNGLGVEAIRNAEGGCGRR